jgi:ABC-type transporter MlaC component
MIRMKKALTGATLVLIALASGANAQDSSPGAEGIAAAHELITAQDQAGQMKQVSEALSKMMQEQFASTDPATAKFMGNFLRNALSPDSPAMKKFIGDMEALQVFSVLVPTFG